MKTEFPGTHDYEMNRDNCGVVIFKTDSDRTILTGIHDSSIEQNNRNSAMVWSIHSANDSLVREHLGW